MNFEMKTTCGNVLSGCKNLKTLVCTTTLTDETILHLRNNISPSLKIKVVQEVYDYDEHEVVREVYDYDEHEVVQEVYDYDAYKEDFVEDGIDEYYGCCDDEIDYI